MPFSTHDPSAGEREPLFVSPKEAARLLGLSRNHVYDLLKEGAIESRYLGKRRQVVVSSLHDFIESLPAERGA